MKLLRACKTDQSTIRTLSRLLYVQLKTGPRELEGDQAGETDEAGDHDRRHRDEPLEHHPPEVADVGVDALKALGHPSVQVIETCVGPAFSCHGLHDDECNALSVRKQSQMSIF